MTESDKVVKNDVEMFDIKTTHLYYYYPHQQMIPSRMLFTYTEL